MFDDLLRQFSGGADLRKIAAVVDAVWEQRDSLGDAIDFFATNRDQMNKALSFVQDHGDELIELVRAVPDIVAQAGTGIEAAGRTASMASRFLSGDDESLTAERALSAASVTLDKCQGLVADLGRLVGAISGRFGGIPLVNEATAILHQGGQRFDDVARQLGDASAMCGRLGRQLGEAGIDLDRTGQQLAASGGALRRFGTASSKVASPERPWALVAAALDLFDTPSVVVDVDPDQVIELRATPTPDDIATESTRQSTNSDPAAPQPATTPSSTRQAPVKKTPAKRSAVKPASAARKAPAKRSAANPASAARKAPAKKTPAKRSAAKATSAARKTAVAETSNTGVSTKKAPARRTATKASPAKRAAVKKVAARRVPAKKSPAPKAPPQKPAKKTASKRS